MHFGLKSLDDLPPLEEFEEAFGDGVKSGAAAQRPIENPAGLEVEVAVEVGEAE
jgi:hypothetical protein